MLSKQKSTISLILTLIFSILATLPAAAGLFQWSRLNRLIPQSGFEPSVTAIVTHPTDSRVIYAGTLRSTDNTNLIFKSVDGGVTWQPASNNLPNNLSQNTGVRDMVLRPDAPTNLYAGLYREGVWLSLNGGQNWTNNSSGSIAANDTVHALAIDPSQPGTIYALTSTGVHVSTKNGSWQARSAGLPETSATIFNDLTAHPPHSGLWLYAATNPQGVYRSTNGGMSWQPVNDGLPAQDLDVRGITVSSESGRIIASIVGQGLWRSDNQGDTWVRSDSGITYNSTLSGNVGVPIFSPVDGNVAYVYNNDGVFASLDGGETWWPFNDGFTGAETVAAMAFNAADPNRVYAGTSISGIWSQTVVPGGRFYVPVVIR